MRRLLALVALLGLVAVSVASAAPSGPASSAAPAAAAARHVCGSRNMTFYFWPQGHQAVPSVKFPAFPTPHMEAYTAAGVYNAFVDSNGALSYAKACRAVPDLPARWASTKRTTIATTMIVQCRLPAVAELKASKVSGSGLMAVTAGHTTHLVVLGNLRTTGSTLTFDKRYCHAAAPPAQATPTKYAFTGMSASFSLGAAPVVYTIAGEVCGDPATTPWTITTTINGQNGPPRKAVLPAATATDAAAIVLKDSAGNETARATLQLTYVPGPPPQMNLGVVGSNASVTNIQVTGAPAAITATPVATC